MQCPKCGTENVDGAQLCEACGYVFEGGDVAKPVFKPKTSRLAIASFVLGICTLLLFFLAGIPSIILGIIGILIISKSRGKLKGKSLAVAGIVISVFLMLTLYLWSFDADPIPNDYTIADLRSAPHECAHSYELLRSLSDKEYKDHNDASDMGLSEQDVHIIYQVSDFIKEADFSQISKTLKENAANTIEAWANAEKGRNIVNELNRFPEIADLTKPDLEAKAGFLPNLKLLAYLYQTYVCLQVCQGADKIAVKQLIEYDSVVRKLSVNARSIVARLVCFAILDIDISTASFIVNDSNASHESVELLAEHFQPLTNEQTSVRNAIICEYLMFRNTLDKQFRQVTGRSPFFLKRNSTLRVYRNFCDAVIDYANEAKEDNGQPYSVWPSIYPDCMPDVSIAGEPLPWECWQYKCYNPLGCLFMAILTPNLGSIVRYRMKIKVHDDLLQIILNKRLGRQVSMKARAYSDEYIIDVENKMIFSPGLDGEAGTEDDIKLPINPEVSTFAD